MFCTMATAIRIHCSMLHSLQAIINSQSKSIQLSSKLCATLYTEYKLFRVYKCCRKKMIYIIIRWCMQPEKNHRNQPKQCKYENQNHVFSPHNSFQYSSINLIIQAHTEFISTESMKFSQTPVNVSGNQAMALLALL